MLKDFPLQMQYSNFNKMSTKDKLNMQDEIFKRLNDVHGPVIDTYGEILEEEDKIIIHSIVDVRE